MTVEILSVSSLNIKTLIDPAINPETGKKWRRDRSVTASATDYSLDSYGNLTIISTAKALAAMLCFGDGVVRVPGRRDKLKSYKNGQRNIKNGCAGCPIAAHCDKIVNTRLHKHGDLSASQTNYVNATALMSKADAVASPEYQAFAVAWIAKGFISNAVEVMSADQLRKRIGRATPEAAATMTERAANIAGSVQAKEAEKVKAAAARCKSINSGITSYHEGVARSRLAALKAALVAKGGRVRHLRKLTAEGAELRVNVAMWQDILASAKLAPEGPAAIARRIKPGADAAVVRALSKLGDKALPSVEAIRASGIWDDCQFEPEVVVMQAQPAAASNLADADLVALDALGEASTDVGRSRPMDAERAIWLDLQREEEERRAGVIIDPERPDIDAFEDERAMRAGYGIAPRAVVTVRGGSIICEPEHDEPEPLPTPAMEAAAGVATESTPTATIANSDNVLAQVQARLNQHLRGGRFLMTSQDGQPEEEPAGPVAPADLSLLDIVRGRATF